MKQIRGFQGRYRFLSNFWNIGVIGIALEPWGSYYPTVEHAFQALKMMYPSDREEIRKASSPSEAKRMGRRLPIRSDWETVKVDTMHYLLRLKFQNPYLRQKLLATGDAALYEENTWGDQYWGTVNGVGANVLGNLLVLVREEIQEYILDL